MRIQHNIAAINSNRQLASNNSAISKNLEKLSSGYKINRAGDDAAGLAISEKMRSQITGLSKAQDNANDGISLVQTAEGALTEVHSMLNRMTELATQSANGTYDDTTDRKNLQKEVDSLLSEIDRISDSTNYNGIKLLDGSLSGGSVKSSGTELTGKNVSTFTAASVSGAVVSAAAAASLATSTDTFDVDGQTLTIDWSKGEANKVYSAIQSTCFTGLTADGAKELADKLQTLFNDEMKAQGLTGSVEVSSNGTAGGTTQFELKSANSTSSSTIGYTGTSDIAAASLSIGSVIFGNGTDATANTAEAGKTFANTVTTSDKFTMTINGTEVSVTAPNAARGADMDTVATDLLASVTAAVAAYNSAMGTTGTDEEVAADKFSVTVDKSGGFNIKYEGDNADKVDFSFSEKTIDGVTGTAASLLGLAGGKSSDAAGGSGLTLQVGDTADDYQKVTVSVDSMNSYSLGINGIDISSQGGADTAIDKIKKAINTVSATRGDLGAVQNRLEHTINNLGVTEENMTSAESRIRDTDMAKEMMQYTKNNILIQASQSMLAQANQLPQGVLQLLQ